MKLCVLWFSLFFFFKLQTQEQVSKYFQVLVPFKVLQLTLFCTEMEAKPLSESAHVSQTVCWSGSVFVTQKVISLSPEGWLDYPYLHMSLQRDRLY